jgi:hypothetical protein
MIGFMKVRFMLFLAAFLLVLPAFPQGETPSPATEPLKCDVRVEDGDFVYGLRVSPSDEMRGMFLWEGMVKNGKTGEMLARFRGKSMRGQENVFERTFQPDSGRITLTTSVEVGRDRIAYRIQRTVAKRVVFFNEGDKEVFFKE